MTETLAPVKEENQIEFSLPALEIAEHVVETPAGKLVVPGHHVPEKKVRIDPSLIEKLVAEARGAADKGYAPFSKFFVGAAVIMADDPEQKIYTGANSENGCLNCGCCAERSAIFAAVSNGYRQIKYVAVSCAAALDAPLNERSPCGECRQSIREFTESEAMGNDTLIFVDNGSDDTLCEVMDIDRLLPYSFKLEAD